MHSQNGSKDFHSEEMVPWMSGLVSGLQNRVRRFESARNLGWNRVITSSSYPIFYFPSFLRPHLQLHHQGQMVAKPSFVAIAMIGTKGAFALPCPVVFQEVGGREDAGAFRHDVERRIGIQQRAIDDDMVQLAPVSLILMTSLCVVK